MIDDSPTIRLSLRRIIEALDPGEPDVSEAASAAQALAMFDEANADLVFLDINLGEESGDDVLRELLQRRPESKIVLVTSAQRDDARVQDAIGQGAFAFLAKPLRRDDVARVLAEVEHEGRRTRRVH